MENRKEQIEEFLKKYKKFITKNQLLKRLNIAYDDEKIDQELCELLWEGKILIDDQGQYMTYPEEYYIYFGVVTISNRGKYFVQTKHKRIHIPEKELHGAKKEDHVYIELLDKENHHEQHFEGKVIQIIKKTTSKNGSYLEQGFLKKEGLNYTIKIKGKNYIIPKKNLNSAYPGDKVLIEISQYEQKETIKVKQIVERKSNLHLFETVKENEYIKIIPIGTEPYKITLKDDIKEEGLFLGKISDTVNEIGAYEVQLVKKMNHKNAYIGRVQGFVSCHGFPIEFQKDILEESKQISEEIDMEEIKKRKDFRNLMTFTIDPITAEDLDDAVSLEVLDHQYRLYVHIADVSYYVSKQSKLNEEARRRGVSLYFPNLVFPMLENTLSKNVCSLKPNKDRLAKTFILDLDCNGNLLNMDICHSIIHSDRQFSYDYVDQILSQGPVRIEDIPYLKTLYQMKELSEILEKQKMKRGFLSFGNSEYKVEVNEQGNPTNIYRETLDVSHKIIENFMLITNEAVAKYAYYLEIPFVYRNHEFPSNIKTDRMEQDIKKLGYRLKRIKHIQDPKVFQKFILTLKTQSTKEEFEYLKDILLKALSRALYEQENKGHYGLALGCYATITSPIRRYSDLMNHQILDELLKDGNIDYPYWEKNLKIWCNQVSERQYEADQVELEVDRYLKEKFIHAHIHEQLHAVILFITEENAYISTEYNFGGIIPLKGDFKCKYGNYMIHKKSGKIYQSGDRIIVSIRNLSTDQKETEFQLIEEKSKVLERKMKND